MTQAGVTVVEARITHLAYAPEIANAMQRWAKDDLRSLNAQIEFVLREALRQSGRLTDIQTRDDVGK